MRVRQSQQTRQLAKVKRPLKPKIKRGHFALWPENVQPYCTDCQHYVSAIPTGSNIILICGHCNTATQLSMDYYSRMKEKGNSYHAAQSI